ncbi:MAG: DUF5655 domain-containing protein [Lentimicrobiaceae bacterium]|jgi:hypothetical protein|nr:DUF5655 domain-containing protein [Lentimicrobiaceae bacterium]
MWTCPKCNRSFRKINQGHSCVVIDIASHFIGKKPELFLVYEKIYNEFENLENVSVSAARGAILFNANGTFLALKIRFNWVDVEFFLSEEHTEFPVRKTIRLSKTRFVHFVRLENTGEVDKQLIDWFKISLELVNKKINRII